jgi:Flp pilus assembly protein TadD
MPGIDKSKLEKFRKGQLKFVQIFNIGSKQIASLFFTGYKYFSEGKLEEAKKIYEGLALLDPDNPYVHSLLGAINQQMQQFENALKHYTKALQIFPQDINSLTNRGEIYLNLGNFKEAGNDLNKAIKLDPNKKHPSANRARLLSITATEALKLAKNRS